MTGVQESQLSIPLLSNELKWNTSVERTLRHYSYLTLIKAIISYLEWFLSSSLVLVYLPDKRWYILLERNCPYPLDSHPNLKFNLMSIQQSDLHINNPYQWCSSNTSIYRKFLLYSNLKFIRGPRGIRLSIHPDSHTSNPYRWGSKSTFKFPNNIPILLPSHRDFVESQLWGLITTG